MPYRLPGDAVWRWRCLDSQAWAIVALVCVLYVPQMGRTCLGELGLLYVAPVCWALLSVLALGEPAGLTGSWQAWRLRAAWLTFAGLAPFVSWWLRCPDLPYLAAAAVAAQVGASWALLETTALISRLARTRVLHALVLDALVVRVGLLYLLVIPMISLWVTFGVALLAGWATVPGDWLRFWRQIPDWGRFLLTYAPLLALLNLARLLLRTASALSAMPPGGTGPQGEPSHDSQEAVANPPDRRA